MIDEKFSYFTSASSKSQSDIYATYANSIEQDQLKEIVVIEVKRGQKAHNIARDYIEKMQEYIENFAKSGIFKGKNIQYYAYILASTKDIESAKKIQGKAKNAHNIPFLKTSFYSDFALEPCGDVRIEFISYEDLGCLAKSRNAVFQDIFDNTTIKVK